MAYAGDLKSLAARIVGSSPTAPTTYCLRARVPQGCGPFSFRCRWGSNPRGGERQADAQRPQRAGEGAGRRPKPVRICAANTRTSHRPYHVIACELVSLWDAGSFLLDAGGARVRPLRHQPTCLVRGGFTPCDSPIHLPHPRVQQSEEEPFAARDQRGPSQLQSPMSF